MAKQDDYVRYTIRVPAKLYEHLQRAAGEKSVNAEIVQRLEWALPGGGADQELRELIDSNRTLQTLLEASRHEAQEKEKGLEVLRKALDDQRDTFVQFLRAVADDDKKVVQDMLEKHKAHLARFTRDHFFAHYVMTIAGIDDPERIAWRVKEANQVAAQNGLDVVVEYQAEGNERSVSMKSREGPVRRIVMWDVEELPPGYRQL